MVGAVVCVVCNVNLISESKNNDYDFMNASQQALFRRFITLLERHFGNKYPSGEKIYNALNLCRAAYHDNYGYKVYGLACCDACSKILESFCDLYHEVNGQEVDLRGSLEMIANLMEQGSEVSERCKFLEEACNEVDKLPTFRNTVGAVNNFKKEFLQALKEPTNLRNAAPQKTPEPDKLQQRNEENLLDPLVPLLPPRVLIPDPLDSTPITHLPAVNAVIIKQEEMEAEEKILTLTKNAISYIIIMILGYPLLPAIPLHNKVLGPTTAWAPLQEEPTRSAAPDPAPSSTNNHQIPGAHACQADNGGVGIPGVTVKVEDDDYVHIPLSKRLQQRPEARQTNNQTKLYGCEKCGKRFDCIAQMRAHKRKYHRFQFKFSFQK